MFKVLCITGEEGKVSLFSKNDIFKKETSFQREQIYISEVTVKTRKGKVRKKTLKKLEKLCENEENVYTNLDSIKHLEKNKNNARVMNCLPSVALKKWANMNGISLSDEQFALVVGDLFEEEKKKIYKIASCVKLMTIYNCNDAAFADELLEKTGLCAKLSDEEIKEDVVIYTKDSLAFEDRRTGSRVYDVRLEALAEMKEYSYLPAERILENYIKSGDGEKIFKKNKFKISGFYRENSQ